MEGEKGGGREKGEVFCLRQRSESGLRERVGDPERERERGRDRRV